MIPKWNAAGLIPPIRPSQPGHSPDRSPYTVSIDVLVDYFSFSEKRIEILYGLLLYRKELYEIGIIDGFQWIDGSFVEKVEEAESRDPRDVDVVTFYALPNGQTQTSLLKDHSELFNHERIKSTFLVDSYYQQLGDKLSKNQIVRISYWYSMWSHRRDGIWKGFIQVDLNQTLDYEVLKVLNSKRLKGAWS